VLEAANVTAPKALAEVLVFGGPFLASVGQAGYGLSQGDISGVIGLALGIGITAAWAQSGAQVSGDDIGSQIRDPAAPSCASSCASSSSSPPNVPPGESVDDNIDAVWQQLRDNPGQRERVAEWWINKVKPGGDWDYKLRTPDLRYENFGNFNYGATGRALFSSETLQRGAGAIQLKSGPYDSSWGVPWGGPPYGDQPIDNFWIRQGVDYYEQRYSGGGVI
jgi:hypothetical protein